MSENFNKNVKKFKQLSKELMETFAQLKEEIPEGNWEAFYEEAFDNIEDYFIGINNCLEDEE